MAVVLSVLSLAACQPGAGDSAGATGPPATTTATPGVAAPATDPVAGVVTHVDSQGLDAVTGFTLRTLDGQTYKFVIGQLENGTAFPPGHLVEHATTSAPILVTFEADGSQLVAIRLVDAPVAATGEPSPS